MSQQAVQVFGGPTPLIQRVGMERPWVWLACGWQDMRRAPAVSLAYGLTFTVLGLVLVLFTWLVDLFVLVLPLSAGFMLVGPILAVGLYETSRRHGLDEPVTFADALGAWRRNTSQIALMGVALMLFLLAWIRLATLIYALFFGTAAAPGLQDVLSEALFSVGSIPFLVVGTATGAVLAVLVFAISVVSIPMLLDREEANAVAAIATSMAAVRHNPQAMAVWAGLIVLFTAAGLVTFYLGLIVALPLIGHASWYAYKDVVAYAE